VRDGIGDRPFHLYNKTEDGDAPFLDWLDNLRDRQARAIIKKRLDRIALGNLGDTKSVGDGVFEFRIDYGPGYRVYFAQVGTVVLLLLCGGDKRTQDQDIVTAKNYWNHFNQRENANN
jgi:putative addiction module killer protein